jgi:hypothetical protein
MQCNKKVAAILAFEIPCQQFLIYMHLDANNGVEGLYKARSYLDRLIRKVERHERWWEKPVPEERKLNNAGSWQGPLYGTISLEAGHLGLPNIVSDDKGTACQGTVTSGISFV